MMSHKNLAERVQKSKSIKVLSVGPNMVRVQGTKDTYTVRVVRTKGTLKTHCVNDVTGEICKGNSFGRVCYHSIRAALELASGKGYRVSFCISEDHSTVLSNLGGGVYTIKSQTGDGELWMVVQEVKEGEAPKFDWRVRHLEALERQVIE